MRIMTLCGKIRELGQMDQERSKQILNKLREFLLKKIHGNDDLAERKIYAKVYDEIENVRKKLDLRKLNQQRSVKLRAGRGANRLWEEKMTPKK